MTRQRNLCLITQKGGLARKTSAPRPRQEDGRRKKRIGRTQRDQEAASFPNSLKKKQRTHFGKKITDLLIPCCGKRGRSERRKKKKKKHGEEERGDRKGKKKSRKGKKLVLRLFRKREWYATRKGGARIGKGSLAAPAREKRKKPETENYVSEGSEARHGLPIPKEGKRTGRKALLYLRRRNGEETTSCRREAAPFKKKPEEGRGLRKLLERRVGML